MKVKVGSAKEEFKHRIKNYLTLVAYKEHVFKPAPEVMLEL